MCSRMRDLPSTGLVVTRHRARWSQAGFPTQMLPEHSFGLDEELPLGRGCMVGQRQQSRFHSWFCSKKCDPGQGSLPSSQRSHLKNVLGSHGGSCVNSARPLRRAV